MALSTSLEEVPQAGGKIRLVVSVDFGYRECGVCPPPPGGSGAWYCVSWKLDAGRVKSTVFACRQHFDEILEVAILNALPQFRDGRLLRGCGEPCACRPLELRECEHG